MLREIRGIEQRHAQRVKRWFQDDYFDLYVWQDRAGEVLRFQLCYERDSRRERALEWQRGRGFQHLKVRQRYGSSPGRDQSGDMALDGALPPAGLQQRLAGAGGSLPPQLLAFIQDKLTEYARPARRFRRPDLPVPRWLARLRERAARRRQ